MLKIKIFVSYARADFTYYPGYNVSRVELILEEIQRGLGSHDPRSNFAVLRDSEGLIPSSYNIDEKITQAINNCDIGLILLSKSYCNSEECERELLRLLDRKVPLSIVETEYVWDEFENRLQRLFPRIERTLRVQFYGGTSGNRTLYGWPLPQLLTSEDRGPYDKAIREVIVGLEARGMEILRAQKAAQGMSAEEIEARDIFVASPTADVKDEVSRIVAALQKAGYSILLFNQKLHVAPDANTSSSIKVAVEKCSIALQLLGGLPGGQIEGTALVPLQHAIIKKSGKPFYVWQYPRFDPSECGPEYAIFLKSTQCHQTSYEEFEQYALKQVASVMRSVQSNMRRRANRADEPLVAIDVAEQDVDIANIVAEALRQNTAVANLPFELDRSKLEEAVYDSDGIVLVYAESREGQLRVNAHFPIIHKTQRGAHRFDIAIGHGLSPTRDRNALPYPRGPRVHLLMIDRESLLVDSNALDEFVKVVRANAVQRA